MNDNIWTHADRKPRDKVLTRNSSSNHNARKNTHDTRDCMYIFSICDKGFRNTLGLSNHKTLSLGFLSACVQILSFIVDNELNPLLHF
jgi:hypothetical protein